MDFASIVKQGEKEYESDFVKIFEDGNIYCFAAADGRETPDAAKIAVQTIIDDFEKSGVITKTSIPEFFAHADELIREGDTPQHACMAAMLTDGTVAVWGNVGDCRIYLLRDKLLYEITPDHSEAYAMYEAGEIRYPKIRIQKQRHELTNMLGCSEPIPYSSQPEMLRKGDSFLICSDGFWENIHERQIEKTLKRSKSAQDWLDRMLKIIEKNIQHKKYAQSRDTLAAITIKM